MGDTIDGNKCCSYDVVTHSSCEHYSWFARWGYNPCFETRCSLDTARARYGDTTISDAGLFYKLEDEVIYARPTLRKEPWLYFVLAIQPALTFLVLGLTLMFHSTPIDKGFGLISILSGVSRSSLDVLRGSSLSGRLNQDVKLIMEPKHQEPGGFIEYNIRPANERGAHNGKLQKKVIYD